MLRQELLNYLLAFLMNKNKTNERNLLSQTSLKLIKKLYCLMENSNFSSTSTIKNRHYARIITVKSTMNIFFFDRTKYYFKYHVNPLLYNLPKWSGTL